MAEVGCNHDHDGYATGYRHALDHVFEYVEHLAEVSRKGVLEADAAGRLRSANFYRGLDSAYRGLLEWISEEDEDDDGKFILAAGTAVGPEQAGDAPV